MKVFFMIAIAALTSSLARAAADDCQANFPGFVSALDSMSPAWKSLGPVNRDEQQRILSQSGKLKTGEEVRFFIGGCSHLAFGFEFTGKKNFGKTDTRKLLAEARRLLKRIPVLKGDDKRATFLEAIDKAMKGDKLKSTSPATGLVDLPCGDAYCQLDASADKQLKLTYDFAL